MNTFGNALKNGALKGLRTARMLLQIMVPIYIGVTLLQHTGFYPWLAEFAQPAMRIFGLSGEAVLPLIVGVFSDEYSVVAAIRGFSFDGAQITIIAMITLCFHSLPVEAAITKKIGLPVVKYILFRLGLAVMTGVVIAYIASILLGGNAPSLTAPPDGGAASFAALAPQGKGIFDAGWAQMLREAGWGVLLVALSVLRVIIPVMIVIEILLVYNIIHALAKRLGAFCRLLGIGQDALLPLLVGLILGVTFGAGTIIEMNRTRPLPKRDMALLGVFLFSCHGVFEAAYLFAVTGANAVFVGVFRFAIAVFVTAAAARILR